MSFAPVPTTAAWRHQGARSGFEVVYFAGHASGCAIEGWTAAVEDGASWVVQYAIEVDSRWVTRAARLLARSAVGYCATELTADGRGHWLVDGEPAAELDGCLDVDLESSAMTNALPVRRMRLPVAGRAAAPAAYVRVDGLAVQRLEQIYLRRPGDPARQRYDYAAPAFDFTCLLAYDECGLVLDYPGIATRAG
jgi:uncharacterized protein